MVQPLPYVQLVESRVKAPAGAEQVKPGVRYRPATIGFSFACNYPDNGLFSGKCSAISFCDPFGGTVELMAANWGGYTFRKHRNLGMVLAGKRLDCWRTGHWVGNWCWDAYSFSYRDASHFLHWLRRRKLFTLDCAPVDFAAWWDGDRLNHTRLRRWLEGKCNALSAAGYPDAAPTPSAGERDNG